MLAIAFAGFVQVSHVHTDSSKVAGHDCSFCSVAHSGVLSSATYQPTPAFIRTFVIAATAQAVESSDFIFALHIRPPPSAKA
jgi:hypothetical protein